MKKVFIYLLLLLLVACQSPPFQDKENKLKKMLANYQKPSILDKQVYLITITGGCGGCMQVVADYIKENIADEKHYFIVSCPSQKEVSFTFNYQIRHHANFLIDNQMIAVRDELVGDIHPKVYYCKNGNIINEEEITFTNAKQVFANIKIFLDRQ
ncbi:hypothetical protein [Thermoflexibacter ruber]|uniref:Lipoprotein n=1 Tax=Thermoflexibacter ruber TaxID=1003 RepID=A0A1I2FWW2_9BACT|nr:hypothetical protein [Thermoflexibacter ruber]SFF09006.1 hypothetical protein SAMN04488541_101577 [Thermoflexibacter ruber]